MVTVPPPTAVIRGCAAQPSSHQRLDWPPFPTSWHYCVLHTVLYDGGHIPAITIVETIQIDFLLASLPFPRLFHCTPQQQSMWGMRYRNIKSM